MPWAESFLAFQAVFAELAEVELIIKDMEQLKHECGVAMIRLLKPLDYYETKYGTWAYGFNKL